ncbi:MAG: acyl-CoA dehydrogenase family protein [SAR202 cluster bacterium]|nr:acyl-CoA dehydrogenase family protein [SAR202 cluster bacterium]
MDFKNRYTKEQEEFRQEVRSWLEENVPADLKRPLEVSHLDTETYKQIQELRRKLGRKGWLHPAYPKEYGGGGLSSEQETVIGEELDKQDIPNVHDNPLDLPALMVWGTEEQKMEILRPRLLGEKHGWQLFTESGAGSDLASLQTRAVRDGDEWVITGQKVFVGGDAGYADPSTKVPDDIQMGEMFTLAVTDPDAPRHRNMGYFMIPGDAPGITVETLDLLVGQGKRQVYLDNVRIPATRLIGGETQGWQVAQTTLEIEHGGGGDIVPRSRTFEKFMKYAREKGLDKDSHNEQVIMQAHIDNEILRLFSARNYWMYSAGQEMTFHGSQQSMWRRESGIRTSDAIREVAGLKAMLDFEDSAAPLDGEMEVHQRESLTAAHPGGTIEIQKVIIARRMGISRTRERAAPTPSTARQA